MVFIRDIENVSSMNVSYTDFPVDVVNILCFSYVRRKDVYTLMSVLGFRFTKDYFGNALGKTSGSLAAY